MLNRKYQDAACPLDGYEGYTFRILVNPTGKEKTDWAMGDLGVAGCEDCKAIQKKDRSLYCPSCTKRRKQFGEAAAIIFAESHVEGFDFSNAAAALASFSQDMPDEFLSWLYMAPSAIWAARFEQLKNSVASLSGTSGATS